MARIGAAGRRLLRPFQKALPGGGYMLPLGGGWLPPDAPWNFWQLGMDPMRAGGGAVVHACVAAYAQTAAMCPARHFRSTDDGGRERITTSALSRVLKRPNSYQSTSDFFLNLTGYLYDDGNAYALALRNNRFEVAELHLMNSRTSAPRVAVTGDVFYNLSGNPIVEKIIPADMLSVVPARDVLHVKLDARNAGNPLLGEPPLTSALLDVAASNNMVQQALQYSQNQARPSGVIETDEPLERPQMDAARAWWDEMTRGMGAGGTPILAHGMKWKPTTGSSRDAQLAEMLSITDARIATVYRVPLQLLSLFSGSTGGGNTASSTQDLMRFWVASGLGFCLNHIEDACGRFFNLMGWPDEYLELDTAALERSNMLDRVEALARGVQGGIYAPNEARALEDLPAAKDGDEPRVQQQVIPLSFASNPPAPPAPPSPPPAEPAPPPKAADVLVSIQRAARRAA
jgi:HK97 family phage portal protein